MSTLEPFPLYFISLFLWEGGMKEWLWWSLAAQQANTTTGMYVYVHMCARVCVYVHGCMCHTVSATREGLWDPVPATRDTRIQGQLLSRLSVWAQMLEYICINPVCLYAYIFLLAALHPAQSGEQDEANDAICLGVLSPSTVCVAAHTNMYTYGINLCSVSMYLLATPFQDHCWLDLGMWSSSSLASLKLLDPVWYFPPIWVTFARKFVLKAAVYMLSKEQPLWLAGYFEKLFPTSLHFPKYAFQWNNIADYATENC